MTNENSYIFSCTRTSKPSPYLTQRIYIWTSRISMAVPGEEGVAVMDDTGTDDFMDTGVLSATEFTAPQDPLQEHGGRTVYTGTHVCTRVHIRLSTRELNFVVTSNPCKD